MKIRNENKIALVTGSSSGIGLLTAVELAKGGFRVVATMRSLGRRERLETAAVQAGVADRIHLQRLDITEFDSLRQNVSEIVHQYGRVDVLVNNAGVAIAGFAEDLLLSEVRAQLETNFFGHVAMTQAIIPHMRQQRSGHIITISSILGMVGQPVVSSYVASKHALEGWSEALRMELLALGIKTVLIEPGAFRTDIWDRNVQMGERTRSPDSPNILRTRRYVEHVQSAITKRDAIAVAKLVVRVAQDENPRLRYRIGSDAHFLFWMKRVLPWKILERILERRSGIN